MDTAELKIPDLSHVTFELDDGIVLKPVTETDVEDIFSLVRRNEAHLVEFMHWMVPDYSIDMSREFVERSVSAAKAGESAGFRIYLDNVCIGSIGFVHFDTKSGKTEIGYWIDKAEEGKGIVTAATKRLIDFAFTELGLNRVEIRCAAENKRSAAIPKRLGFKMEGRLREAECRNGRLHDFLIFGLLRSEWAADRALKGVNFTQ